MPLSSPAPVVVAAGMIVAGGILFAAFGASAQTPAEKGLAISIEADKRDLGYGDFEVEGRMLLRNKQGQESWREFRSMTLERPEDGVGDMSILVFEKPRDVRGTALLTHANVEPADDDQWLYLPAVKRVKRISSSNRTGKFVSSEFSFEDLGGQEVNDYTYEWLRDEACPTMPGAQCFVVSWAPKNAKSGYSKTISWIDQDEYRLTQAEFYNRRGDLEKILKLTDYQQYLGQYWRPGLMSMENQQTGKSTDLIWSNYKFRSGLSDGDFDSQRLSKASR